MLLIYLEKGEGDASEESPKPKEPQVEKIDESTAEAPADSNDDIVIAQTEAKEEDEEVSLRQNETTEVESSPRSNPPRDDLASLVLMWILILSIAFLVYRRLKKIYGIDLVTYFYSITS